MNFFVTTFDGLAGLVREQLAGLKAGAVMPTRHGQLIPFVSDAPAPLLRATIAEDVFIELGRLPMVGTTLDVRKLERDPLWAGSLTKALNVWSEVNRKPITKKLIFRVVVQADDATWRHYRRDELRLASERALMKAGSWRVNRDEAPLEIWLFQTDHTLVAGLRLTTNEHRQRGGREVEREAALRPSVAAAMVWLSGPADTDVVLDPMCGSGTLLLERATSGRYSQLIGGDSEASAVKAALDNFGPRHQPRRIERWDARALPLDDQMVTTVLCNLPWGRKIGEQADMPALYLKALQEMKRVLIPGGTIVLLSSERRALTDAVMAVRGLSVKRHVERIEVLGRRADIVVLKA